VKWLSESQFDGTGSIPLQFSPQFIKVNTLKSSNINMSKLIPNQGQLRPYSEYAEVGLKVWDEEVSSNSLPWSVPPVIVLINSSNLYLGWKSTLDRV
jgi:hypothetical protein